MDIPKSVLSSKEALLEFLKTHKYKSCPSATDIMRSGKKLVFIFLDDSIDDHIRGTLANYGINPDDYEEYKYGYDV